MLHTLATPADATAWLRQRLGAGAATLRTDSRQVRPGDAFIAWPGAATDGRRHVAAALAAGAAACLVEADGVAAFGFDAADPRLAAYPGLKAATGPIAAAWFGEPAERLALLAVTATNGKSSTAWWTAQALGALGRRCGVVGTLGIGEPPAIARPAGTAAGPGAGSAGGPSQPGVTDAASATDTGSIVPTGLTTPDPVTLQAALRRMADEGYAACAIEASSIGIVEQRLAGTHLRVAQFINFTRDHLDYHGSMAAYWAAKRALFDWPGLAAAVVDIDDPQGAQLADELAGRPLALWTTGRANDGARLRARGVHYGARGLGFEVVEALAGGASATAEVATGLVGEHNVHNLLAVLGGLRALGVPLAEACAVFAGLTAVPGRMQPVPPAAGGHGPEVVVDYAHTPDALEKALAALQPMAIARGGRLWCVFGCGGNRDATKRPLMGAIAQRMADRVVLTSDNPRDEDPHAILAQIRAGLDARAAVEVIEDRAAAIAQAVRAAAPNDVVLVAGKGHEDYQEVRGQRRPFLDLAVARAALAQRAAAGGAQVAGETPPALTPAASVAVASATPYQMTLAEAAALLPGAVLHGDGATPITRVHTDTRSLQPGDLFVALRGERFDAHDFLPQARAAGATAAIAEHGLPEAGLPGLQVADTLAALQQLAAGWRARFTLPLIGVTGSNGKTTVTQMLARILAAWQGEAALATAGNLNNHIGLPLMALRLRASHRAAVLELGMNHPGEIALLAGIARPTVGLVNNAQREHQEFMATVEAVARENASVFDALPAEGTAVFPADEAYTALWRELAGGRRSLSFGEPGSGAEVTGTGRWTADAQGGHWALSLATPAGAAEARVHAPGRHNLRNALAASAAALAAGAPLAAVVQGLGDFRPVSGRSQLSALTLGGRAVTLVNDSYNANPDSVRAAVDLLAGLPGPHWLVLGDMGEVGDQGPAFHAEVGGYARAAGIAAFWTAGAQSAGAAAAYGPGARHFADTAALVAALDQAPDCASALVKGSRFMRMETVVQALQQRGTAGSAPDKTHQA